MANITAHEADVEDSMTITPVVQIDGGSSPHLITAALKFFRNTSLSLLCGNIQTDHNLPGTNLPFVVANLK
jgi:hypothetical protein